MGKILAIDPGTEQSAFAVWDGFFIVTKGIEDNETLLKKLRDCPLEPIPMVIEQIRCYGMAIGQTTLDTVFWSGRFWEVWKHERHLMPRMDVKMHLCGSSRAKDSNIRQALIDRFEPGLEPRKRPKGVLKGLAKDTWAAMALAVTWMDKNQKEA